MEEKRNKKMKDVEISGVDVPESERDELISSRKTLWQIILALGGGMLFLCAALIIGSALGWGGDSMDFGAVLKLTASTMIGVMFIICLLAFAILMITLHVRRIDNSSDEDE